MSGAAGFGQSGGHPIDGQLTTPTPASVEFDLVTVDASDTEALSRFWAIACGLHEVEREDAGRWIVLAGPDGQRRMGFQRATALSASVDNSRIHLDLSCAPTDFELAVERLLLAGARLLRPLRTEPYGAIANLVDPEGNVFDLCAYV